MKKRWMCLCTALALTAGVCVTGPLTAGAAPEEAAASKSCNLRVYPVDFQDEKMQSYWEDMKTADVVVDLYDISEASDLDALQQMTAEQIEEKAQQEAKRVLESGQKATISEAASEAGAGYSGLDGGLYLVVAHGRDMEAGQYMKTIKPSAEEAKKLVAVAHSNGYEYRFTPQLVALPTWRQTEGGASEYIYDAEVVLKSERGPNYGSLEIQKTLLDYEAEEGKTPKPADFVFHVEGRLEGEVVYDAYDKISFTGDGEGTKTVRLDWIPAGSEVRVTEVYSGASYRLSVPGERTAVIEAGQIVSVDFENVYDGRQTNGHGIKNQFVYDGESESWRWYSDPGQEVPGSQGLPPDTRPDYLLPASE